MTGRLSDKTANRLERLVYEWLAETETPGASLVIVNEDGEAFSTGIGARDRVDNLPATPDTLYPFASVTKSVTALAVLQQVEKENLALNESIAEYIDISFDGIEEISIHDLLTHSSGLPSLGSGIVAICRTSEIGETGIPLSTPTDLKQYLADAGEERDDHSLDRFQYNNEAYNLLEYAIESVTDRPFPAYVSEEILTPLGMDRSTFDFTALAEDDNHATPYKPGEDGFEPAGYPVSTMFRGPGGLASTPREMGSYLRYQLTGTTDEGEAIVSDDLLETAHAGHVEPLPAYGDAYGYGWAHRNVADRTIIGHGGSLLTAASAIGFVPEEGVGIALATAGQPNRHPTSILEGLFAILFGEEPADHQPSIGYHERVDAITGEYTGYRDVVAATVEDAGGHLTVNLASGPIDDELILVPTDPTLAELTFEIPSPGRTIKAEFVKTPDGYDLFFDRNRLHKKR